MRILLCCLQDLRLHPIPAYRFWATAFRSGIAEAGHISADVPGVDWAEGIVPQTPEDRRAWRERTWSKTLDWIAEEKRAHRPVDLFLSYLYPEQIEPAALAEIQRWGIPCVNFFCDNLRQFTRVPSEFRSFNLHWVPEFEALAMYRRAGLTTIHAPMPMWIPPDQRGMPTHENGRAGFIGSFDPLRRHLLGQALGLGAAIDIGGVGWQPLSGQHAVPPLRATGNRWRNQLVFLRAHGVGQWLHKIYGLLSPPPVPELPPEHLLPPISGEEYFRLTKEYAVTIGINRVPTFLRSWRHPLSYSRLRDIEAPMAGACYLTEWTEGLVGLYDIGREIEAYRTAEELVEKLNALKADPARRKHLRIAGQRRALTDHTITRSLRKICDALGLSGL